MSSARVDPVPEMLIFVVLGGTSAINGMMYVRGQSADYDHWAALGNRGWSYQDVAPIFRRMESYQKGDDGVRRRGIVRKVGDPCCASRRQILPEHPGRLEGEASENPLIQPPARQPRAQEVGEIAHHRNGALNGLGVLLRLFGGLLR